MTTSLERATRWRARAEECRTLAVIVEAPTVKSSYLDLARTYDTLAENAGRRTAATQMSFRALITNKPNARSP